MCNKDKFNCCVVNQMLTHSKCHSGIEDTNVMLIWIDNVYTLKKLIF